MSTPAITLSELRPGMLVRDGLTLLQISSVYPPARGGTGYVTAQVLLEGRPSRSPGRTTVRSFLPDHIEMFFAPATEGQLAKLDQVYRRR